MTHYQKAVLVMDFLQDLGVDIISVARATDDRRFDRTWNLLVENPDITKEEFLRVLETMEVQEDEEDEEDED